MSIDQLEQQLADLRVRVEELEGQQAVHCASDGLPQPALEAKALSITRDLFPGPIGVEVTFDPQEPERKWRVISVPAIENLDQATAQWRRRMFDELGAENVRRYSLRVEFTDR